MELINRLLNSKINKAFLQYLEHEECPRCPESYKILSDEAKRAILEELQTNMRDIIIGAVNDLNGKVEELEDWLNETLIPQIQIDIKSLNWGTKIVPLNQSAPSEPYDYFEFQIAMELLDVLEEDGLMGFKECPGCGGLFVKNHGNQKYCTQYCRDKKNRKAGHEE